MRERSQRKEPDLPFSVRACTCRILGEAYTLNGNLTYIWGGDCVVHG